MPVHDDRGLTRRTMLAMGPALAVTIAGAAAATPDADQLPPDLARALSDYHRATVANDTATLGALVTDDYVLVNSDSSVQGKHSYLADFDVPGFHVDPYEIEEPLYKLWGDVALTGWVMQLGWTQSARRQGRRLRIAHIWVNGNGRWRLAYTQLTRVPQ
jgi:ketosteroid isomerase-like protein